MSIREVLNLTANEEKVYKAMIQLPNASAQELARSTNLPRPRVYEILARLVGKTLIEKTLDGYRVIPPEVALQSIKDRIEVTTVKKLEALKELSPQLNNIWKTGVIDKVIPGIEILSFVDLEPEFLVSLTEVQHLVYIAAPSTGGGINWKTSGEALAKSFKKNTDVRYLYSSIKMAAKMKNAFNHFVPFKEVNIKTRINHHLESSFVIIDEILYVFFMSSNSLNTHVLLANSPSLVVTFKWLFQELWDQGYVA